VATGAHRNIRRYSGDKWRRGSSTLISRLCWWRGWFIQSIDPTIAPGMAGMTLCSSIIYYYYCVLHTMYRYNGRGARHRCFFYYYYYYYHVLPFFFLPVTLRFEKSAPSTPTSTPSNTSPTTAATPSQSPAVLCSATGI